MAGLVFSAALASALGTRHSLGCLAVSSAGKKLVGAVNGYVWPKPNEPFFMYGVVKVWDAATGKELALLAAQGTWLRSLAISPDGSILAVAGDTPVIEIWDLDRGTKKGIPLCPPSSLVKCHGRFRSSSVGSTIRYGLVQAAGLVRGHAIGWSPRSEVCDSSEQADAAMILPASLDYPLIAIADLHGQRAELERLIARLEKLAEWPECALVFLGDFVDRGDDVPGTIDFVLQLLQRPAGGSALMGNHDLALVRAARLDDGPTSPYWIDSYLTRYDHDKTFCAYLGREPHHDGDRWVRDLDDLRASIPQGHRVFLESLPWVVESAGHLFLHCGLSPELGASAAEQVAAMHRKQWDRSVLTPRPGTKTDTLWQLEYPVWLGADKKLSKSPLAYPGKVQVTGHVLVSQPDANAVRIRLDTSGGFGRLTACLLRAADAEPLFIASEE